MTQDLATAKIEDCVEEYLNMDIYRCSTCCNKFPYADIFDDVNEQSKPEPSFCPHCGVEFIK